MLHEILALLFVITIAQSTNYSSRRPIYSPVLARHLPCCTAYDTVLSNLKDRIDDTEDESKDLEDKVKRLSRQLLHMKKTQYTEWFAFKKTTDELSTKPQGVVGSPGEKRSHGGPGNPGIQGLEGLKGSTGVPGNDIIGLNGRGGSNGNRGSPGPPGAPGAVGAILNAEPGTQGPQGQTGHVGRAGDAGEPGSKGSNRPTGLSGDVGWDGNNVNCLECLITKCDEHKCYAKKDEQTPNIKRCDKLGCYSLANFVSMDEICLRHKSPAGCPVIEQPISACPIPSGFLETLMYSAYNPTKTKIVETGVEILFVPDPLRTQVAGGGHIELECNSDYCFIMSNAETLCEDPPEVHRFECTKQGWCCRMDKLALLSSAVVGKLIMHSIYV